ncbi:hypothetical protein AAEU32_13095 [Pseudoalteromonas sp. SSDWG2]|uniref:hypothetical protein n=1 Tax=Pseudoalteromonas sp. SSDWG2 TaxID=3139391 RepID=UPI003BA9AD95
MILTTRFIEVTKTLSMMAMLYFLCACKSTQGSAHHFVGVELLNVTEQAVEDVKLRDVESGGQVSCTHIEANTACGTLFPSHDYHGQPIQLSYKYGHQFVTHEFHVDAPVSTTHPYRVYIRITDNKPDVSVVKHNAH